MDWFRWWHGSANDPKLRLVAHECSMPVACVVGIWAYVLECASSNHVRGQIDNWDSDVVSFHLGVDVETPCNAMKRRNMLHETDETLVVCNWDKWQPKREREDSSTVRVKKHRELKKQELNSCNSNETPCNANDEQETPREEKRREEETTTSVADKSATVQQIGKPPCPADTIIALYHELMPLNPAVKVMNEARRKAIRARWREAALLECAPFGYKDRDGGISAWRRFFEICAESDFLTGKAQAQPGKPPFIADIDFLMSPSGFAKCLENKYHRDAA